MHMKNIALMLVGFLSVVGSSGEARAGDALPPTPKDAPRSTEERPVEWREQAVCIDARYYDQIQPGSKALGEMQKWDPVAGKCPLDPGRATQLALAMMKSSFTVPSAMKAVDITLSEHLDCKGLWYYSISFAEGDNSDEQKGSWATVDVYLDGTVPGFRKGELNPFFEKLM